MVSFATSYFTGRFNNCPINSPLAIRAIFTHFLNRFQHRRLLRIQANGEIDKKEAKSSNKLNGQLADVISNVLAVKSSGAEATEQKFFTKTVSSWRDSSLDVMRGFLKVSTIYSSINMVIKIGAIAFAVYAAQNNLVSVASVYLIITYTGSVAHELWNMNGIMRNYNRIIGNANDMVEILQTPTTLIDKSNSKLKVTNGEISMDKVTFTHDEGQGDTLFHDFSLNIKPGEK